MLIAFTLIRIMRAFWIIYRDRSKEKGPDFLRLMCTNCRGYRERCTCASKKATR